MLGPNPRRIALLVLAAAALSSAGCTSFREYVHNGFKVGPNYSKPAAPIADEWIDSLNPRIGTGPMETAGWWRVFGDPVLDRLIETSYRQNISLREAGFRIAESQSQRAITVGNLFPQSQELFGDYSRIQRSQQTATFPRGLGGGFGALVRTNFDNWRLGSAMAWELDFWGRYRRAIESADATLDAAVEDYDDALVLLISEVASSYIDYRTLEQRLIYANENIGYQTESARVAKARLDAGRTDAEVDSPQANSNLARTQAAMQVLEISNREAQNRLCVLLGMPPHDLSYLLNGSSGIPAPPETMVVDVPSSLLRRRPDIRRAERLVAAQSAQIGIAQTNLYPAISINGTLYMEAGQFANLFKNNAWSGSVGPAFRWNVLNYGRLVNLVNVQDAILQQRIAAYQQQALLANEEAENSIIGFLRYHDQVEYLVDSVREAQQAERVSQLKYNQGAIDYNRLFTIQTLLVQQQDAMATARGNSALSIVELYRAMGGGWEIRLAPPEAFSTPEFAPPVAPQPGEIVPAPMPVPAPAPPPPVVP